uniref:transposase n=1 Tax=Hungatella hathewayi TaxID=154046 RepID=UPI003567E5B3
MGSANSENIFCELLEMGFNVSLLTELADQYSFQILAMKVMPDHIHPLMDCRPQFMISDMVKSMKGNLAGRLLLDQPELKK